METYQNYVIKDGKFIGQFEEMYQKFDNPWHQNEVISESYSRLNTVLSLKRLGAKSVLEAGCGLGKFTNYLSNALPDVQIVGMDISETAVHKARETYPSLRFMVGNLVEIDKFLESEDCKFDVIIFSERMWYILPELREIISKLKKTFAGKYIMINQTFYTAGQQYGREFFTNLDEMIAYLGLEVTGYSVIDMKNEYGSYETHSIFKI